MKKLIVQIPLLGRTTFSIPKINSLSLFLAYFQLKLTYIMLFVLPFTVFFLPGQSFETGILYAVLLLALVAIGIFIVRIILYGEHVFIDPKGFLVVLTFALLTTVSSLSVNTSTTASTFGTDNVRGLSGIFIMGMLAIYYLINATINDKNTFKRTYVALLTSATVYAYVLMFTSFSFTYGLVLLSILPLFLGLGFTYKKLFIPTYIFIIGSVLALVFGKDMFASSKSIAFVPQELILLTSFISLLVIGFLLLTTVDKKLKSKKKSQLQSLLSNNSVTIELSWRFFAQLFLGLHVVVLLGYFVYALFDSSTFNDAMINSYDSIINASNVLTGSQYEGFQVVQNYILGVGSNSVASSNSLFGNVLEAQGLFGVIGYLLLFGYAIAIGAKLVVKSKQNHSYFYFISSLYFYVIAVALLSIFITPSIFLLILWWIGFSFLTAYDSFSNDKEDVIIISETTPVTQSVVKHPVGNLVFKATLSLLIISLIILLIYQLAESVGEV